MPGIVKSGPIGMTAKAISAAITDSIGASVKTTLSAPDGVMSSLKISLTPSASGWSRPSGPTRFGP